MQTYVATIQKSPQCCNVRAGPWADDLLQDVITRAVNKHVQLSMVKEDATGA